MIYIPFIILVANIAVIFLLSKRSINQLAVILRHIFKSQHIVYSILAFLFFPGTVIHEMAHFFMATIVMLKVHHINLLPQWEHNTIKLGSVTYYKKDVFRSILVGIAPIFLGIGILWWLSLAGLFPARTPVMNIAVGYFIFILSSTMFSSKQDLIDVIYILPLIAVIAIVFFIFRINVAGSLDIFAHSQFFPKLIFQLNQINKMLFIAVVVHTISNIAFSGIIYLFQRRMIA